MQNPVSVKPDPRTTPPAAAAADMIEACTACGETRIIAALYDSPCRAQGQYVAGLDLPGPVVGPHTFAWITRAQHAARGN